MKSSAPNRASAEKSAARPHDTSRRPASTSRPPSTSFELAELHSHHPGQAQLPTNSAGDLTAHADVALSQPPLDADSRLNPDAGTSRMSRTPLLLRSSPAFGTGSYGNVPVTSLASSSSSDVEDNLASSIAAQNRNRKAKNPIISDDFDTEANNEVLSTIGDVRSRREVLRARDTGPARSLLTETLRQRHERELNSNLDRNFNRHHKDIDSPPGHPSASHNGGSSAVTLDIDDLTASEHDDNPKRSYEIPPEDDSPYPEVRASVSPTDDTTLSINTPRMWTLSLLFAILGSSTNLFFSLRYPSVSITPVIALLLAHPLGLLWDQIFTRSYDPPEVFVNGHRQPTVEGHHPASPLDDDRSGDTRSTSSLRFRRGSFEKLSWTHRARLWLAQGRWNAKEHCCVYVSSNVSFGFAFATDIVVEQSQFYHQKLGMVYQILLILSTQILGYALAGLGRRFLVQPSGMIWPSTLMSTAMFTSLHTNENKPAGNWRISRTRFFVYVMSGSVAFYFIPGLLMPALSYFNVMTWFAPKNVVVANLFGVVSGLGMFPLTFDWSQIAYIGSPLVVPFWAALNVVGGLVLVMWIIAPLMYYANIMYSSYMPILSAAVFDNAGKPYDVSKILTSDFVFNEPAYLQYSRVFLPITYVLSYALQFAGLAALITHTACWHGKDIWRQWRRSLGEIRNRGEYQPITNPDGPSAQSEPSLDDMLTREDIHNRLMRKYDDVPMTWYLLTGISMTLVGMFVVEYYPIYLPWYGLLLALGICIVLFIPIGIVTAITNQHTSIYLICQLICGVVFPGRPVANMVFIAYGYITSAQGIKFTSDLKLGHYMKVPPRILFMVQLVATIVSSLTQIGVLNWMLSNIRGICTPEAINGFTCPIARVHFNGSILWGVIGPRRFFGPGALYRPLIWAFLVGAVGPIALWFLARKNKKSLLRKVNLAVVFGSLSWIPPATGLNFSVWAVVCWLFNHVIKKRRHGWWAKYTMPLSAALDSGLALGVVIVFFGFVYPGWMDGFKWWGTEIYKQGCDWQACSYKQVQPGHTFGPRKW